MLLIQAKDLECNGIFYKNAKRIRFQGNSFERGVTFSKRLRQAAADLYQEELAAGNSCLIVDDETHFTLWYQTNDSGQTATAQADIPNQNTVQGFMQRFAATKRTTLTQPALSSEQSAGHRHPSATASSTTASIAMPKQNRGPSCTIANQPEKSQSTLFKIEPQQPLTATPTKPLATISNQNSGQTFSVIRPDPFISPYLGPYFIPAPSPYRIAFSQQ